MRSLFFISKGLTQLKKWSQFNLVVLALIVQSLPCAYALTDVHFTAERIEGEGYEVRKAQGQLTLGAKPLLTMKTQDIRLGETNLRNARVTANPEKLNLITIEADLLDSPIIDLATPRILLDMNADSNDSGLHIQAKVKQQGDTEWGQFYLHCNLPTAMMASQWDCQDGRYLTQRADIPFGVEMTSMNQSATVIIRLKNAKFSDTSGLHAGENLDGQIRLFAQQQKDGFAWQAQVNWAQGALFWQPFYIEKSGHTFEIAGRYRAPTLEISKALLHVNGVGDVQADAEIDLNTKQFSRLNIQAKQVDFAGLYPMLIQPMLQKTAFGNLSVAGVADWSIQIEEGVPQRFHLTIADATIEDKGSKFGFQHFNADIPWDYNNVKQVSLGYQSGHLLKIPLGKTHWQAEVNRFSITAPELNLPVLDGALHFEDVSAAWVNQQMVWHLQMQLQPISMNSFSRALGWPPMRGTIDGVIPLMTYANEQLVMQGDMQFNLFNGLIGMSDLQIKQPLGLQPELFANLRMRDIDLGEITRTFNFGSIEGKLEGDVRSLTLKNWKATYMDAKIQTADGKHEKKISQRAVENITALGGEGTAAALQRTFLRFFKEFNYEKIGLGCELRGDICRMSGVEATPTGFVIVKGKGAPSVNVNGYTKYVSWKDLLARMERITDGNTKAVVK